MGAEPSFGSSFESSWAAPGAGNSCGESLNSSCDSFWEASGAGCSEAGGCPLAALGSKAAWRLASMTARISSVSSPVSSSGSRRGALAGGSLSSAASSSLDNPQGSPRPFQLFVVRRSAPADWRLRPRNALTVHAFLNVGGQGFFYGGTRFEQWLSSFLAAVSPGLPLPGNDAALAPDDYR